MVKFYHHISRRKANAFIFKMQPLSYLERGDPFLDLSQKETIPLFLFVPEGQDKERERVERSRQETFSPGHHYVLDVYFRRMKSCGLYRFLDMSLHFVVLLVIISKIGRIFYNVHIYLQKYEALTVCGVFIHSSHRYLLSGLQSKMISFNSHCGLTVGEESRIIIILSLQAIRLHFREVK